MAPKASNKTVQKKKDKLVSDKTFGLKNKNKSKKVQEFVSNVKNAAKTIGKSHKELMAAEASKKRREAEKLAKAQSDLEMKALFKTVIPNKQTEVPVGVDPRTVLCAYFKAGNCVRGQKCKFSHNMETERKTAKLSVYVDPREQEKDTMDKWDQAKLEAVVESKYKTPQQETKIVCKHFLDAIEKMKYGWFWECPTDKKAREEGGVGCIYKHRLPPGFVFTPKADKKQLDELEPEDAALLLMESIEEERKALDLSKCTPVTLETFKKWKDDKKKKKEAEIEQKRKEEAKKTGGKGLGVLSGRDLFKYDPSLFVDDADAVDDKEYQIEDIKETQEEMEARVARETAAEEAEMARRAQFEARAELYRNDSSADATTVLSGGAAAVAESGGGTTTAIAFQLPASLMAKPKPVVGDASLFEDEDEAVDDGEGESAAAEDGDGDGGEGGGDGGEGGEGESAAAAEDGGEGESAAAAEDGGEGESAAAGDDTAADDTAAAAEDDTPAAAAADATDAKSAPAKTDSKSKSETAAAGAKPAVAAVAALGVGDASLFDDDLSDLPDS